MLSKQRHRISPESLHPPGQGSDDEFYCIPTIEAKPDFKTSLGSIFASRTPDDPIIFDPEYEPHKVAGGRCEDRTDGTWAK